MLVRDIKRLEFEKMTGIKHYTYRKMVNKEDVTTDTLRRICFALNVSVDDILDFIPDEENETLPASGNR